MCYLCCLWITVIGLAVSPLEGINHTTLKDTYFSWKNISFSELVIGDFHIKKQGEKKQSDSRNKRWYVSQEGWMDLNHNLLQYVFSICSGNLLLQFSPEAHHWKTTQPKAHLYRSTLSIAPLYADKPVKCECYLASLPHTLALPGNYPVYNHPLWCPTHWHPMVSMALHHSHSIPVAFVPAKCAMRDSALSRPHFTWTLI